MADTGPGIRPDVEEKLFDPFFTTKPEGSGTGLGLSICYGIVRDHGGRIWLDSKASQANGGGAAFTIELLRDARSHQRLTPTPMPDPRTPAAAAHAHDSSL